MEEFTKVIISLTGSVIGGRYKLRYHKWFIFKETDKTITVQKGNIQHRFLKKEMLEVKPDLRNERISALQYYTTCRMKDINQAAEKLELVLRQKVEELQIKETNAVAAWLEGTKLEEI